MKLLDKFLLAAVSFCRRSGHVYFKAFKQRKMIFKAENHLFLK